MAQLGQDLMLQSNTVGNLVSRSLVNQAERPGNEVRHQLFVIFLIAVDDNVLIGKDKSGARTARWEIKG